MTPACCNAVHCICGSMQKLSNVQYCAVEGWEKAQSPPEPAPTNHNRVGPPTPCASPELMKHSNASDFPKLNPQSPARSTLPFSHAATALGLLVRAVPLSIHIVGKDFKPWLLSAGQLPWDNPWGELS